MPSPIGHSLMGVAIYSAFIKKVERGWKIFLLFIIVSNLPDIDYLPGFIMGNPNKYHHMMSHSLAVTIAVGILFAIYYRAKYRGELHRIFLIFSGLYFSHIVLDYFTLDTAFPYGEQLFWPFNKDYYLSPFALFLDVHKASSSDIFLKSIFCKHNLGTMALECGFMVPLIVIVHVIKSKYFRMNHYNGCF